jgi:predicted DNA-binding protein
MSKQDQLVLVGAKVPTQWKEQIEALALSRGQNASEVVREAIAGYLKLKPEDRDQSLAHRVRELEKKLLMLTQLFKT